jgi:hypothetical protein
MDGKEGNKNCNVKPIQKARFVPLNTPSREARFSKIRRLEQIRC